MAYYRICPECGCTLDPGEICDCREQREKLMDKYSGFIRETRKGQMEFVLEDKGGLKSYESKIAV